MSGKKYSKLLLDEAVLCYRKFGSKEAVRLTGVHPQSIANHWRKQRIKEGIPKCREHGGKYTPEQKIACIQLAIKYKDSGYASNIQKAFKEAGKKLGMNGNSICFQWTTGNLYGIGEPAQHPGTDSETSGASIQAASPQDQRCAEHQVDPSSLRPAPKIIKRRRYTSEERPTFMRKGH